MQFLRERLAYIKAIKRNKTVTNFELTIKKKDGSFNSILYSAWLIYTDNEKILISTGREITDLKQAEKKFNESDDHYRKLFNSMNEMFQVVDLIYDGQGNPTDYYFREVNPAFEKYIGKSKEQLIDKRAKDIFGIVEDYWLELFDGVSKTGKAEQFENYSAELDRYVFANVWKLGENRIATLFTDFTERKMLEEERKGQNDKYKALFENSLDAVLLATPEGSILNTNPAAEELFGYTEEELCRLGRDGIVDYKDPKLQDLLDINEKRTEVYGEHYFIKKDGTKFMAEISASVYKNENGYDRSSIIIRDITERRNAEKSLKNSHQKIDEILGSIRDSFYVLDHDYNFIYINETAAHYFRYAEIENFIGRNFWQLFPKNLGKL